MVRSAAQSARNSARISLDERLLQAPRRLVAAHNRAADSSASRRGIGEVLDRAHLLDADAVDLLDLADEDRHGRGVAELDRELVDRHAVALLEHVDADDVAVDGTDARRDESERPGPVGEPDPDQDVETAHPNDGTAEDDASVSEG